jgi:DNA uptake protein ComE-like DNA-binding protein
MKIARWVLVWLVVMGMAVMAGDALAQQQPKAKAPAAAKVDLNSASQADLEALPGVGEATAKKIVAGRPYKSVADLEKAGVNKATIEKITPLVTVGAASADAKKATAKATDTTKAAATGAKVDLNSATKAELEALPGVGEATANKIVAGRPYKSVADLEKAGVNKATIEKITPLVVVGPATGKGATAAPKATDAAKPAETAAKPATSPAPKATDTAAKMPPQKGMVWVNTDSGIFHKEGDRWYGKTKQGEFMTEADALKKGYREAKN